MFSKLPPEVSRTLAGIPRIIDEIAPVPARFRKDLSKNIRDLSELLTSGRQSLSGKYLGSPAHFSAYLRYFLPWNLFRLCKLFSGGGGAQSGGLFAEAAPFLFADGAGSPDAPIVITDLGSGPLTLPVALWISMPALRDKNIEFRCFDINRHILKTGEQLFERVAGASTKTGAGRGNRGQWKIKTVASSLTEARAEKKSTLVTAVNVYNELYWKLNAADTDALAAFVDGEAARLASFCGANGAVLIVEPGIPRSGTFIAHIRNSFIERGFSIDAPCTHHADCPMETSKVQRHSAKWCHFTFSADDAPATLRNLSRTVRLPKEDGVLSFLLAHRGEPAPSRTTAPAVPVRITSGAFPLPDMRYARYGCCEKGLVLLAGTREETGPRQSGSTVLVPLTGTEPRDKKSGALIARIPTQQPRR
ncbi:MAG: small ribosomal subunit Rsm22 family protein [Spirochaetaceae bacterium]|jgi:hypothetical protein|nr:small ribosomal subunit Rsm22 family protein [Spirochaetaceae bacterium]